MGRLANSGVVHVQVVANGAHHHFPGVEADAYMQLQATRTAHLLGMGLHGCLHRQGGVAGTRAIQFSNTMPMSARAAQGWAAKRRQAAAMLVSPAHRIRPMTVLRRAAITCGILPHRTGERSSSKVTSRTPCDWFSICQCPRTSASKRAALARSGPKLVTPATTSSRHSPVFFTMTCRSI